MYNWARFIIISYSSCLVWSIRNLNEHITRYEISYESPFSAFEMSTLINVKWKIMALWAKSCWLIPAYDLVILWHRHHFQPCPRYYGSYCNQFSCPTMDKHSIDMWMYVYAKFIILSRFTALTPLYCGWIYFPLWLGSSIKGRLSKIGGRWPMGHLHFMTSICYVHRSERIRR